MLNINKNLKGENMKHMRENVSKKINYLDAQQGKLEIYFEVNYESDLILMTRHQTGLFLKNYRLLGREKDLSSI